MEETARRKEKIAALQNSNDVNDTVEINDMLIDAIKAKIAILEKLD
jgi:hypothetical protein